MSAPALELLNVTLRYPAGVPGRAASVMALDRLSLRVQPGECVGVAGEAGTGKTTLLLCAAGLLNPDAGVVRTSRGEFVSPSSVTHPYLSIRASLEFQASLRELAGWDGSPDITAILRRTGLTGVAQLRVGQLSAGLHARAMLAHALLAEPRLLCIDHPLAALDLVECERYGRMLESLRADGMAMLVSDRETERLARIGARVLALRAGRISAAALRAPTLELDVSLPRRAAVALADRLPGVRQRGCGLRVPLDRVSAEEVLSACLSLGIVVHGSRVISGAAPGRVAERGQT